MSDFDGFEIYTPQDLISSNHPHHDRITPDICLDQKDRGIPTSQTFRDAHPRDSWTCKGPTPPRKAMFTPKGIIGRLLGDDGG